MRQGLETRSSVSKCPVDDLERLNKGTFHEHGIVVCDIRTVLCVDFQNKEYTEISPDRNSSIYSSNTDFSVCSKEFVAFVARRTGLRNFGRTPVIATLCGKLTGCKPYLRRGVHN
jgi:hypothetical protein